MTKTYNAHPLMFKNHPFYFVVTFLLCFVGIGFIIYLFWYISCKSVKITIENDTLIYEKGLLSKSHTEIGIDKIKTLKVQQSFMQRIMGVGDIEVYTAGDIPEIVAKGLPDADKIRELI